MNPQLKSELKQALARPLIQYLLLFLAVLCVYLPTLWYTFVWDDYGMIAYNKSIRDWKNIPLFFTDPSTFIHTEPGKMSLFSWRPVRNIYFLITYKLHGLRPAGWHFQHVLLHSLCALVVLGFFRRIYSYARVSGRAPASSFAPVLLATWFATLIWAVHPANTEILGWMKAIDDILAVTFGLSALILLIPENGRPGPARILAAAILYPIGMLTKESIPPLAVIYPLLILLLGPSVSYAWKNKPAIIATAILVLETLVFIVIRDRVLGKSSQGDYLADNFSLMMATMTTAVVRYLQLTFWPFWPTTQIGSYLTWPIAQSWMEVRVVFSTLFIVLALLICLAYGRRSRVFLCGVVFTLLAFLPVANILPMVQVLAERFMYFPLIGVALSLTAVLARWFQKNPPLAWVLPAILVMPLIITTELRLRVWVDEITFQKEIVRVTPNDPWAVHNLGSILYKFGHKNESLAYFQRSLDLPPAAALKKLKPAVDAANNEAALTAARILSDRGDYNEALVYVDKALALSVPDPREIVFKGDILRLDGQTTAALVEYRKAIKAGYDTATLRLQMAQGYARTGNVTSATAELNRALQINPSLTGAHEFRRELRSRENGI